MRLYSVFENSYDFISGQTIRRGVYYGVARVTCLVKHNNNNS